MVGLIKKEFHDSFKAFFPMILLSSFLITLLCLSEVIFHIRWQEEILLEINYALYDYINNILIVMSALTLVILGLYSIIKYIYLDLYKEKGYELFTLPYSSSQIIFTKIFMILLWGVIILVLRAGIQLFFEGFINTSQWSDYYRDARLYMFYPDTNMLVFRSYLNRVMRVILAISAIFFVGALTHSKYLQSRRHIVSTILIVLLAVVIWNIDNSIVNYWNIENGIINNKLMPNGFNNSYFYDFYYSTFWQDPYNFIVNTLMIYRTMLSTLFLFGTGYLWKYKLQF